MSRIDNLNQSSNTKEATDMAKIKISNFKAAIANFMDSMKYVVVLESHGLLSNKINFLIIGKYRKLFKFPNHRT